MPTKPVKSKQMTQIFTKLFSGKNVLMVGIIGPNSPCEEVMIKHLGQREYNVTYTVLEPGDYVLVVKWGDEHIPGSPFHVNVP
jgi:filamin